MIGCGTEKTLSRTAGRYAKAFGMSLPTKGSQPPPTTSYTQWTAGAPSGIAPVNKSPSHRPDLVGKRYGSVEIVSPDVLWLGQKQRRWIHVVCECVTCGYRSVVSLSNLQKGRTKGCRTCNQPAPEYPMWLYYRVQAQKHRCTNPNNPMWGAYGGRGIEFRFDGVKQATLWIIKNLGIPEDYKYQDLDRIDPDGHYEPGNIRWLHRRLNLLNRSGNQATARIHQFRIAHPEVRYADATLKRLLWSGMSFEDIVARYYRKSDKPKGKYGTYSTPDPTIASLVKGS